MLREPERLRGELQRRQESTFASISDAEAARAALAGLKRQLNRLRDMYQNGFLEDDKFEAQARNVQGRLKSPKQANATVRETQEQNREVQALLVDFDQFVK